MSTRKIAFVSALLVAMAGGSAAAQSPERDTVIGGVKGGLNLNTLSGEAQDYELNVAVAMGAWLDVDLGAHVASGFGVRPELMLTDKGADYVDPGNQHIDESLLYLELPILARYTLPIVGWLSATAYLGPQVAYLLDAKQLDEGDDTNRFDLGAVAGAGADFHVKDSILTVDLRLDWGLLDVFSDDNLTARTRTVAMYFGVSM